MKTTDLSDALLDYWTARAEGVPADELEIRPVQRPDPRTPDTICVRMIGPLALMRLDYSTNWALCGPLVEKHFISVESDYNGWWVQKGDVPMDYHVSSPLTAICRSLVRAAFGDEVEDLEVVS